MADHLQRMRRCIGRSPDSTTVAHSQRTCSSPAIQVSTSREVRMTRTERPVSGSMFCDSAVRLLEWKGAGQAMRAEGVGRDVFMSTSSFFLP